MDAEGPAHERPLIAAALEATTAGVLICSAAVRGFPIVYANPAFAALTGYETADVLGRPCSFLQGPETDAQTVAVMREALGSLRPCEVTILNYRADGTPFWNELSIAPVLDDAGRVVQMVGIQNDVSPRKRHEAELTRLADSDPLTGLANRRRFREDLDAELARVVRHGGSLAVILLDLDDFKAVNDRHGHQTGDSVLRAAAEVLKAEARRSDRVARLGGDEFVVLLSEVDADQAQATARRLRERLRTATGVGASAGVATTSEPAEDSVDELIRRADAALYAEKRRRTGTPPRE